MTSGSARWVWAAACLVACGCTAVAGLDKPFHLHEGGGAGGESAGGGGGAGGGTPAGCEDEVSEGCVYARCGDVPASAPGGVFTLDPDDSGPLEKLQAYCGEPTEDGDRWALVYNSVGATDGATLPFWKILFADRLEAKGEPSLGGNHYQPSLYVAGREYSDEVEDIAGTVAEVMRATAEGIDTADMHLLTPIRAAGEEELFTWQFATGWSSPDFDADTKSDGNCASSYAGVTQHYGHCFVYNLGADDDEPIQDEGWGPHISTATATAFGLSDDGSPYTRVKRISRWTRW
ncbi:fibrinogen-like YCDxxxxGGGW domain-containing protein [Sorangium sp. So ce1078]|uniref:fibrinogen-like YCDxxxxGGGW domain-containing protein n=1 Tax=Sorangium sp. So ce1078 TaxID=3133329 RepID=UPI003F607F64